METKEREKIEYLSWLQGIELSSITRIRLQAYLFEFGGMWYDRNLLRASILPCWGSGNSRELRKEESLFFKKKIERNFDFGHEEAGDGSCYL